MKVLLVNGSPRANGNTARALREVADALAAEGVEPANRIWHNCGAGASRGDAEARRGGANVYGHSQVVNECPRPLL